MPCQSSPSDKARQYTDNMLPSRQVFSLGNYDNQCEKCHPHALKWNTAEICNSCDFPAKSGQYIQFIVYIMELAPNRLSETTLPDFVVLCIYDSSRVKAELTAGT